MRDEMTVNTDVTPEEVPATEPTPETGGESHVESHDDGGTKFTFSVDENGNRSLSLGEDKPNDPEVPQESNEPAANPPYPQVLQPLRSHHVSVDISLMPPSNIFIIKFFFILPSPSKLSLKLLII